MSGVDDEKFKSWNPMKDDYLDSGFNLYDSGPGAALDSELQPAELAKLKEDSPNGKVKEKVLPYLVFKNLPKNMTAKGLKQLCERYGNVKEADKVAKLQSVFVKFNNIADMESVHRALSESEYGFKVYIGKHFLNQRKQIETHETIPERALRAPIPDSSVSSSGVMMENRTIRASDKNPPRPKFSKGKLPTFDTQKSAIIAKDPLCHVIKDDDAHSLERAGLSVPKTAHKSDEEYEYRTGRAHRNLPEKTRAFLEDKHNKSNGKYDTEKGDYCNKDKNKENLPVLHKCIVCKRPSDMSCYRCSPSLYIYCGRQCQTADWENHRKICGRNVDNEHILLPMKTQIRSKNYNESPNTPSSQKPSKQKMTPPAEKSPSISSDSSQNDSITGKTYPKPDMPTTNSVVAMTAVSKTNIVFIRSKTQEDDTKFFEAISKVQAAGKKLKPLKKLPNVGQAVISKFKNGNQYGRALVLNVADEENIKLNFLDYGNIETQNLSNLFNAPAEFIGLPRFAIPIVLKGVPNYYMTNEIRSFMYSYLREIELVVKYDKEKDLIPITNVYQVDLYDAATSQHLNETIVKLCKPNEPTIADEILSFEDLEIRQLPVGKNVRYYVMDNSQLNLGCISCTTKDFAMEIEKFAEDIQRYANSLKQQSYAPRQNELCIAKYSVDGLWYRGRCLEKVGDGKPTILFIDYGNIAYVKVADIRPYPPKFDWPIYTGDFGIEGLPEELNEKLVQRLEELIPFGCAIDCDLVEYVEGNFYNITKPELINKLKMENLLD